MPRRKIDTEDKARRLRCPRGHTSVGPTNHHFLCASCARHWEDVDPEFDYVEDAKTGERYSREDLELHFDVPGVNYA